MAYKVEKMEFFNCHMEVWHYSYRPPIIYIFDNSGKVLKISGAEEV